MEGTRNTREGEEEGGSICGREKGNTKKQGNDEESGWRTRGKESLGTA